MAAAERAPAAEMDWVEAAWAAAETVAVALGAAAKVEVAMAWAEKGTVAVAEAAVAMAAGTVAAVDAEELREVFLEGVTVEVAMASEVDRGLVVEV